MGQWSRDASTPPFIDLVPIERATGARKALYDEMERVRGKGRVSNLFKAYAAFPELAKANFDPAMLARRTPEDRRQMVERVKSDFGRMRLVSVDRREHGPVQLKVSGSTGLQATIEITLGPPPEERITRVAIELADAGGGEPAEPAPPEIDARMDPQALAAGLDAVSTSQTIVGSRLAWIDLAVERSTNLGELRADEQEKIGGTDIAITVANLQQVMLVLEASQSSFAQLANLSLFETLR